MSRQTKMQVWSRQGTKRQVTGLTWPALALRFGCDRHEREELASLQLPAHRPLALTACFCTLPMRTDCLQCEYSSFAPARPCTRRRGVTCS